jgi:peptidoglycan/LPS O-acetylase OafA/YrhL
LRYNPALDGLRAVAILIVMSHHFERLAVPTGWIGVDVFFVLSGYLITSILLQEDRQTGHIALGRFYIRRALRLTPPFAILIAFELLRSLISADGNQIRLATLVSALYIQNWNVVFDFAPVDVLGHTWSLAVEEQFYWIWPLLLPLVARRRPLLWLGVGIAAMVLLRVAMWRYGFALNGPVRFFMGERPVGLLVGCALAFMPWLSFGAGAGIVSLVGLVVLAISSVDVAAPWLASLGSSVLIMQRPGLITELLAAQPLRYIGRISYGLYLYHFPIFYLGEWSTKISLPFHLYAIGLVALSFAAAALSYEFVEKPILRLKGRFGGRTAIATPSGPDFAPQS